MTGAQSDTERLARAIIDMAEKDKGLVLSNLKDLIERHVYCPPFSNPDGTMSDAYKAFRNKPPAQPEESLEAIFDVIHYTGNSLIENGKLSEAQITIVKDKIQKNLWTRVTIKQEPYDHNTQYGLAAILDDGRMYAVKLKSTMTMVEITETLIRGLMDQRK